MPKRYSDLQLKVLTFYREYLKLARAKPEVSLTSWDQFTGDRLLN